MIVLIAMWATVLSQNMCTPYLAVIAPAHSSSKEQVAEAPGNLCWFRLSLRSSVRQEPQHSALTAVALLSAFR